MPTFDEPVPRLIEKHLLHFVLMKTMLDFDLVDKFGKPNDLVDAHRDDMAVFW